MKKFLVLPIAGKSTRHEVDVPKYALKHPSGHYMVTESIRGLNPEQFDGVLLIGLYDHELRRGLLSKCVNDIESCFDVSVEMVALSHETKDQTQTIYDGITQSSIAEGDAIFIKDCDGYFYLDGANWNENFVVVGDLNTCGLINAGNKSYVEKTTNGVIGNIVEKQVISNLFCVGGYYFKNAGDFMRAYNSIKDYDNKYVSHIIYKLLIQDVAFFIAPTDYYLDWGTTEDWNRYKTKIAEDKSIVIDIDGTLCEKYPGSEHVPYIYKKPKIDVIEKLREYKEKGYYIKISTSRNMRTHKNNLGLINKYTLPILTEWLEKYDVPYDEIYMAKPWAGSKGFHVDDKSVRPDEFVKLSEAKLLELIK